MQEEAASAYCSGANGCIGVGVIQAVGDTGVGHAMHPTWDRPNPICPDALGDAPDAIVVDKRRDTADTMDTDPEDTGDGAILEWQVNTGGSQYSSPYLENVSQLAWLDGTWYVATETVVKGDQSCSGMGSLGNLVLLQRDTNGYVDKEPLGGPTNYNNKPEGLDAVAINPELTNTTCYGSGQTLTADFVVYVADYCQSFIHVFTVDTDDEEVNLVAYYDVSEPSDTLACNISSVRFDPTTAETSDTLAVVCQTRGTLRKVTIDDDDQCLLSYDEEETDLRRVQPMAGFPTCWSNPATSTCDDDCKAHNVDYDYDLFPGWLFVSLTGVGQVTAVRSEDYSVQSVVFRANPTVYDYKPLDHVVVGTGG